MKTHVMMHPRAEELLVERALRPLSEAEHAELASLGVDVDDDSFDLTAAAVALATLPIEAMPAHVLGRLAEHTTETVAPDFRRTLAGVLGPRTSDVGGPRTSDVGGPRTSDVGGPRTSDVVGPRTSDLGPRPESQPNAPLVQAEVRGPRSEDPSPIPIDRARRRRVSVAWVAAAAAAGIVLAVGVGLYTRRGHEGVIALAPSEARAGLLQDGAPVLAWTATADTTAKSASGDVVWSDAQQRGYMRFVGLAVNDPKAWQYQLWIFDGTREQAFPVDGGVFDVSSTGEVIVPISAKLHVDKATLFAVTVERPGGVVVSKRERIVVTAKPS